MSRGVGVTLPLFLPMASSLSLSLWAHSCLTLPTATSRVDPAIVAESAVGAEARSVRSRKGRGNNATDSGGFA